MRPDDSQKADRALRQKPDHLSGAGHRPNSESSCPDFVALSFEKPSSPEVLIVEVNSGSNLKALCGRVLNRKDRWYDPIRTKMLSEGIIDSRWRFKFYGFVRGELLSDPQVVLLSASDDVKFLAIQDVSFSWDYWEPRKTAFL